MQQLTNYPSILQDARGGELALHSQLVAQVASAFLFGRARAPIFQRPILYGVSHSSVGRFLLEIVSFDACHADSIFICCSADVSIVRHMPFVPYALAGPCCTLHSPP